MNIFPALISLFYFNLFLLLTFSSSVYNVALFFSCYFFLCALLIKMHFFLKKLFWKLIITSQSWCGEKKPKAFVYCLCFYLLHFGLQNWS